MRKISEKVALMIDSVVQEELRYETDNITKELLV